MGEVNQVSGEKARCVPARQWNRRYDVFLHNNGRIPFGFPVYIMAGVSASMLFPGTKAAEDAAANSCRKQILKIPPIPLSLNSESIQ